MNSLKTIILLLAIYSCSSNNNEAIETGTIESPPSNLIISIEIVGKSAGSPNGNGSGRVRVIASATNASSYKFEFDQNTSITNTTGEAEYTYANEGLHSNTITVTAFSDTDQSISHFRRVTILKTINNNTGGNEDGLIWSDEFDTPGAVDATKWFHQTQLPSGGNWYNGEVQHYTNRLTNSNVSNGTLKIVAKKETFTDQGQSKNYTSARLNSKYAFQYGKVKVRAKLPTGSGTWPAIWMLGKNITEPGGYWTNNFGTTPWPACGEIDIMEHWGKNQNFVQSAMHTPSSHGGTINHGGQTIPTVSSEFHVYELDWNSERMIFSVDGKVHYTYNPDTKDANTWPFDAEQYILLNIAIEPSIASSFTESSMEIDYVRVYQ